MTIFYIILLAAVSYFLGNFNFGIIISGTFGDDVRLHGSHNAGLTNMLRVYGRKAAALTLLGDAGKGVIAAVLSGAVITAYGSAEYTGLSVFISSFFVMLGHIYPAFFGFRGGKGVLTTAACLAVIDIRVFLCAIGVFALTVAISKYVSLGSVLGAVTAVITVAIFRRGDRFFMAEILIIAAMALIIILKHGSNIKRIKNGTENKLKLKKT